MSGLQSYPGKGKDEGKTFYRTQPYLPDGRRVTFRFGSGQKQAERSHKAIRDLIDSAKAEVDPTPATKSWIEKTATEQLCKTLVECGLIEELPKRLSGEASANEVRIGQLAEEYIKTRGAGQAAGSITLYKKTKRNLIDCFGDIDISSMQVKDGREFWRWLMEEGNSKVDAEAGEIKGLSSNTAKQRLRFARAFFEQAIEDGVIEKNPFKGRGLTTSQTAAEKEYVPWEVIDAVIKHCSTLEWKLLFALARTIPTRVRSEIEEFAWDDVDWANNTLLIHSPKTRKIGKSARLVPILPPLKTWLVLAFDQREEGESYVFPKLRLNTNPGTSAKKFVLKAEQQVWNNFFNSLRASAETDLMDEYGLRKACQWAGNSPATAMKNYALVRKTDFVDDGNSVTKSDAKSDAIDAADAKSDAERASTAEQRPNKKRTAENQRSLQCVVVDDIGLEPTTSSMSTRRSSQLS